jgi:large subunit ribosomal protein L29
MKKELFKDLTAVELQAKGRDMRQELFNLRLQQASSQLEKPSRMRELRKSIARVETQLSVLRNTRKAA